MAVARDPAADRTYHTLDGLRGVAALIVVTRHVGTVALSDLFPNSFLAVDLFFLLSGFVIACAYGERLKAGASQLGFLRTRLTRLYPLYALGLGLGVVAQLVHARAAHAPLDPVWLAEAIVIGLLMLPQCPPLPMGSSTLNGPTWTLLPEIVVNLVYARFVRRLGPRALTAIVAGGAIALVACEYVYGTLDEGWWWKTWPLIGARLAFSFFLGVLMFRFRPARRVGPFASAAALVAVALVLTAHPPDAWRQVYELAAVLLAFPLVMAVAVRREPGRLGSPVFSMLGVASYAVYVLHAPLGSLVGDLLQHTLHHPLRARFGFGLFLPFVTAVAILADKVYDQPVRRWLSGLGRPRAPAPPLRTRVAQA